VAIGADSSVAQVSFRGHKGCVVDTLALRSYTENWRRKPGAAGKGTMGEVSFMLELFVRFECQMQAWRRRILGGSNNSAGTYHCIMAFAVALLAWPVVPLSLAIEPGGVSLLTAETGIFVAIVAFAIFLCWTVIFLPIGALIL